MSEQRWPGPTRIEARDVRIVKASDDPRRFDTDIFDLATGEKFLDVLRAVVLLDGEVDGRIYEVSRRVPLTRDYEGPALLERSNRVGKRT